MADVSGRSITFGGSENSPLGNISSTVTISESFGATFIDLGVVGIGGQLTFNSSNQGIFNFNAFIAGIGIDINFNTSTNQLETFQVGGMAGIGVGVLGVDLGVLAKVGFGMDTIDGVRTPAETAFV